MFIIITTKAQYWHDPLAEEEYAANSVFLADINNQGFCLLKISTTLILIIIYTGFDLNVALIISPPDSHCFAIISGPEKNSSYAENLSLLSSLVSGNFILKIMVIYGSIIVKLFHKPLFLTLPKNTSQKGDGVTML